jgi:ABC-type antimicrobial peptide transport system permease subunit
MGAKRGQIADMILAETSLLVCCGLVLGLPGAILASRLIAGQLFGLKAADPITFAAACVGLAFVALAASYVPARRAASVDPMRALRTE